MSKVCVSQLVKLVMLCLQTVGTLLQYEQSWLQEAVDVLLEGLEEEPLISVTVHDIFWGYEDRFLRLAKDVLDDLHLKSKLITGIFGYYMGVSGFA